MDAEGRTEVSCFLQNEEVFGQTDMFLFGFFYTRGISPEAERTANPVQTSFYHRKSDTFPVKSVSGCSGMTVAKTLCRPDAVNFDFDGLIAVAEPLHRKAFRKELDPLGVRFT